MLDQILRDLNSSTDPLDEYKVVTEIQTLSPSDDKSESAFERRAEILAFTFSEREAGDENPWGTYFTPVATGKDEDGTVIEYPSIQSVDKKVLKYWSDRAGQTTHPVLRARYAGLVWDFSPKVIHENAPIDMAQVRIDAVVKMADTGAYASEVDVFRKLKHVLELAIRINDQIRVEKARDTIIDFQRKVAVDDKAGLWVGPFDLLCCNKKSRLTEEQRESIIQDLEDRLERLSNSEIVGNKIDRWGAEKAAIRLAKHYQRLHQQDDVRRVLIKVGRAYGHFVEQAQPMLAQAWLQQVHDLYKRFGLTHETTELRKKIRKLGPGTWDSLVKFSETMEIKKADMNRWVNTILEGDLQTAIHRFIVAYIPQRKVTEEQLQDLSKEAVLMFFAPINIMDHKGRPVATVGSIDDDLNGRVMMQTNQNIERSAFGLREVVKEMVDHFTLSVDTMLNWIDESPVFDPSHRLILERGLKAYFDGEALLALHLLVPQVENAIRELVELAGGDVYKPNSAGGMDLRSMDDLLRNPITINTLTNDASEYFRILYTDRRGINLRNHLCHGIISADSLGMGLADRVFHTIVMLSQLRDGRSEKNDPIAPASVEP